MRTAILILLNFLCAAAGPARSQEDVTPDNPAGELGDRANFVNGIMFVGWSPHQMTLRNRFRTARKSVKRAAVL